MAKVRLNLARKSAGQKIQSGKNVHTGLTGNAAVPTASPPLTELQTAITAAEAASDAYEAVKDVLKAKMAARDVAVAALVDLLRAEAVTVQAATGGDAAKILSAGYEVAAAPTPASVPGQVLNLRVTPSDHEGALKAGWKRVVGAQRYELQASMDPPTATSWVLKGSSNKRRLEVNTFTSGQRIWLRVRAINAAGEGAWSDPSVKTVP